MGFLSQIAFVYAALFVINILWFNYWLSLSAGFLGLIIIVVLSVTLETINETKAEQERVKERTYELQLKIEELQNLIKPGKEKELLKK